MQLLQGLVAKPSADMADVTPAFIVAYCQGQGSKERARSFWEL